MRTRQPGSQGGSGLGAMELDKAAITLVGVAIFVAGRMVADEVHEGDGVVGIGDRPAVVAQGEPADAAVIKLHELPVGFLAMVVAHGEGPAAPAGDAGLAAAPMPAAAAAANDADRSSDLEAFLAAASSRAFGARE